jgi:GT2 family glycosyltransferase
MSNKIAIIIVSHNGSKWIRKCLTSVFKNEYDGQFDVIVVDNASQDNSADIAEKEFPQVDLIRLGKNLGFVGGNNVAIKEALRHRYDYIILLNQDTEVEPNFLSEIVKVADSDKQIGIVQGMLVLGNERNLTNNVGNAMHYLGFGFVKHYQEPVSNWVDREPFEIGYASGAAMLIKRDVLETVGSFNDKFFSYHEDLDLCWRARLAGYKIMLAPKATVYHFYEFNRNKKMFYWTERNRWAILLQNYSIKTLLLLAPILVIIELMMLAYSFISGWVHYKLRSYVWIWAHLFSILKQRKMVQSIRKVGDREVMRYMDSKLKMSEVDNPLLKYVVSPMVELYYKLI